MNESNKLLSDIVAFRTYAKHLPHLGRRESLEEVFNRNMSMHLDRFPKLSKEIVKAYSKVHKNELMPSMRALQFSGPAVLKNSARQFNCSFLNIDSPRAFGETLFLLLSGCGVGFSVQRTHVYELPKVQQPREEGAFIVQDSIEGWAQAIDVLVEAYFFRRVRPVFDFFAIREKGSPLVTTGAKAPGPEPLKHMLAEVESRLKQAVGRQLKPIEVHDIICLISNCVLAGGIRRAALISLFDRDDQEMLKCKSGNWWEKHPYRARANNSAVLPRNTVTQEEFNSIFSACEASGSGEPGISWTNDFNWGWNPCFAPETLITTRSGTFPIKSLVGKDVDIWNGAGWQTIKNFRVTATDQKVLKITLQDGSSIRVTPYHSCILEDTTRKQAKDLNVGDRLLISEIENNGTISSAAAYLKGFLIGDGTSMEGRPLLYLYEPKYGCESRLKASANEIQNLTEKTNTISEITFRPDPSNDRKVMTGLSARQHELSSWATSYKKSLPFEVYSWDLRSKTELIAGLFDSDGCAADTKNGFMYQLSSISKRLLLDVQALLKTIGVRSKVVSYAAPGQRDMNDGYGPYECQEGFRLTVSQIGSVRLAQQVTFSRLVSFAHKETKYVLKPKFNQVVSIEEDGIEKEVYCCTVEGSHSLSLNVGIQIGQCHEIALESNQFCNLTTVNQTGIKSKADFLSRVYSAAFLGTLQASYTDFPYLRPNWQRVTENGSLIGVSFTGIADMGTVVENEWLVEGAKLVREVNEKYARKIGINPAERTTTIKPEGSSSAVLGSSSGIHARHSPFYLRRIRINKSDSLAAYLQATIPNLIEQDVTSAETVVLTIPQESPKGAIIRNNESAKDLFLRALDYNKHWIAPGHRSGANYNNVSCTLSMNEEDWDILRPLMWKHREAYSGISLLPEDGGNYAQMPFEACTEDTYRRYVSFVQSIDLRDVRETDDFTQRAEQVACAGGSCEIT